MLLLYITIYYIFLCVALLGLNFDSDTFTLSKKIVTVVYYHYTTLILLYYSKVDFCIIIKYSYYK